MSREQPGGGSWSGLGYLKGRAGRKEYWLWFGALCVIGFLLSLIFGDMGSSLSFAFAFVQIRRLHDLGRSGWWLLPVFTLPFALPLIAFELGLLGDSYPFDPDRLAKAESWSDIAILIVIAFYLVVYVWMGVRRGDAGDNRFGPRPNTDLKSIFLLR